MRYFINSVETKPTWHRKLKRAFREAMVRLNRCESEVSLAAENSRTGRSQRIPLTLETTEVDVIRALILLNPENLYIIPIAIWFWVFWRMIQHSNNSDERGLW